MDIKQIYETVCEDVEDRKEWANNQLIWYKVRGPGIRRSKKPWPTASNMHYPLADGIVDKWKPFYIQNLFTGETLAKFTAAPEVPQEAISDATAWFDFKLKEVSNLERELGFNDDHLLVFGRGIIKSIWDTEAKRLHYVSCEPLQIIVPSDTVALEDAPRVTHVKHLSVWDYKNGIDSEQYNQEEAFVKSITGGPESERANENDEIRRLMRGITHSEQRIIILWETWEKQPDKTWMVYTFSPMRPTVWVREPFACPYKLPEDTHPFTDFTFELRQGYYEARGVCELMSEFEASLNKAWNEKHDAMTLYNRPILSADSDMPQVGNVRLAPGQILPFKVVAANTGAPSISWDQDMSNTRIVAQERIGVPDFGAVDQIYGGRRDQKTASEVQQIAGQQQVLVGMRGRNYRRSLARLYRLSWALLVQYDSDLQYIKDGQQAALKDKKLLRSIITISPSGSPESWDQGKRFIKAMQRLSVYRGDPYINQAELRKTCLELDEPGLVQRLFVDPKEQQRAQSERQMIELVALESGMPLGVSPEDDHAIHLQTMYQRAVQHLKSKDQPDPKSVAPVQQHMAMHLQALHQSNPGAAKQFADQFQQLGKFVQEQQNLGKMGNLMQQQQGGMLQ